MNSDPQLLPTPSVDVSEDAPTNGERSSLYRAYRSLTFEEVVGQRPVTQTLRNAVRYGKVAHAYLFTGPRGTGKTSTARILARAVNCLRPVDGEPCNSCTICTSMLTRRSLDLVEIDGASNNSVDDVRELRDRVNLRPAVGRKKVFIIDEVHMLSIGAFNALLKTLEEPPDHILFALATTEIQKVPATVRSRCQLFELRPIGPADMVDRLRYVCRMEQIQANDDVLGFLTSQSTGSLRDALGLLEQVRAFCGDILLLPEVETALGVARSAHVTSIAGAMAGGDLAGALLTAGELMDAGVDPRQLTRQLSGYWRDALVGRSRHKPVDEPRVAACRADQIVPILYSLLSVETATRRSDSPRWALETAIAEATLRLAGAVEKGQPVSLSGVAVDTGNSRPAPKHEDQPRVGTAPTQPIEPDEVAHVTTQVSSDYSDIEVQERPPFVDLTLTTKDSRQPGVDRMVTAPRTQPDLLNVDDLDLDGEVPVASGVEKASHSAPASITPDVRALWPLVMRRLNENRKVQVYSLLQKVVLDAVSTDNGVLSLPFRPSDEFVRKTLESPANKKVLEESISGVFGGRWGVRCVTIDTSESRARPRNEDLDYLEQIAAEALGRGGE